MLGFRRQNKQNRTRAVALLTFRKAGSQWTRDLLTHALVTKNTGFRKSPADSRGLNGKWPTLRANCVTGPIYDKSPEDWFTHKSSADKAIVVLRDPRDLIVSLYYSANLSHIPNKSTIRYREAMLSLPPYQSLMIYISSFIRGSDTFAAWAKQPLGPADSFFITTYEKMVADAESELAAVFEFFGWRIPKADINRIVADLSFETRSGRDRGDENVYSHYRKGVPGDWRQHFDRAGGVLFERIFPGLLVECGYEQDPKWFEQLPVYGEGNNQVADASDLKARVELQAEVVRLREHIRLLKPSRVKRRSA